MQEKVPNSSRIGELWLAIKTLLAGKVDLSALDEYATTDAVATAIAIALVDYAKTSDVRETIQDATSGLVDNFEMASAISNATQNLISQENLTKALSEYMKSAEIDSKIAEAVAGLIQFRKEVVDRLPDIGEDNVIYLVPNPDSVEGNSKLEYMWINDTYELIGSTTSDLSDYWNKSELEIMSDKDLREIIGDDS